MGNRALSRSIAAMLLLAAFFSLTSTLVAYADSRSSDRGPSRDDIRDRLIRLLCDRQEKVGHRLAHPLISPELCDQVEEPQPTLNFSATPSTITQGATSTLSWSTTNVTSCSASNAWSGSKSTSGSEIVSPSATSTYALSCTGPGGTVNASVTVNVIPAENPQPTLTFTATPSTVQSGATSTLAWSTTNATSCTASNGWSGSKGLSGSQNVTPSATTTYALDCTGAGGTIHKEVTVNVTPTPPAPELTFAANPTTITLGATSTLTWSSTNTTSCSNPNGSVGLNGTAIVAPTTTTTYPLDCTGPGGNVHKEVTVTVNSPSLPTVLLDANPTSVTPGAGSATSTLSWSSTNATNCTASNGWSGSKGTSGSEIVQPGATTTYQLDCSGAGGTASTTVTVTFIPSTPSPTVNLTANPTSVTPGAGSATSTLSWTSTNASTCTASNGWTGSKGLSGTEIVQPGATTTYTLVCMGAGGSATSSATVNFVPTPAPSVTHLLISEVYYDVSNSTTTPRGAESTNEWVELYNPTNSSIDLTNFALGDTSNGTSTNVRKIPSGTIAAHGYFVVSASTTTLDFWSLPGGVGFASLDHTIGNGLANGGDNVFLMNILGATSTVDGVSWGSNTDAFNPPVTPSGDGKSSARSSLALDTDTNSDWTTLNSPTFGF